LWLEFDLLILGEFVGFTAKANSFHSHLTRVDLLLQRLCGHIPLDLN